ncbi:MAG: TrkH family potassium uptake protein [Planctomycetota bacterium]|nr:TrkH family potassium uptake protein [Planctomycetota bacterium]
MRPAIDMNLKAVAWLMGCVLLLLAGFMLVPALVGAYYGEKESFYGCLYSALITAGIGAFLAFRYQGSTLLADGRADYFRREGLAAVGISWLLSGVVGAMPFLFSGAIQSPVDALFESVSGFTTTGSTILVAEQLDGLPKGIAFWRSFTHWIGGIGIVLVFVVLFPTGGRSLFRSEVPGISREASMQRVRDSALGLVRVYVILTLLEVVLLWLAGDEQMTWFEAFVHSFGTLATGGFSTHSASVAAFGSWKVELVVIVFMFAAGINFAVYDTMLRGGVKRAWRAAVGSNEIRTYVGMIFGSIVLITFVLWFWGGSNGAAQSLLPDYSSFLTALRDSVFTVISIQTTTGYGTANFDEWPQFCRLLLMLLALCGACAGSTGGGLKVIRFMILAKASLRGVKRFARPRAIHPVRVDDHTLDEPMVASVTGYCGMWMIVFTLGTLALVAIGFTPPEGHEEHVLLTAATSVLATLNNIGPGLAAVGPAENFAFLPDASKLLLALFMVVGRLEFYAVVVLFVPRFWRH